MYGLHLFCFDVILTRKKLRGVVLWFFRSAYSLAGNFARLTEGKKKTALSSGFRFYPIAIMFDILMSKQAV
nr:MAG TPA: hypothetical protein [Caudoviricetes sp.]